MMPVRTHPGAAFTIIIRLLVLCLMIFPCLAWAGERRMALVIGVAEYQTVPKLKNTIRDSELIARTLEGLQFQVERLSDPGLDDFRKALEQFQFEAETADVALIYFAGHGVEFGGANLLLPADTNARSRAEVASQSVTLDDLLASVDKARQLRIVILDSCRDDPFQDPENNELVLLELQNGQRRASAGLAPPSPERGTLVAFAAEAGNVALDGAGANSPFATAIAANLGTEDLEIGLVFRRIRDDVLKTTNNEQQPHTYGSLSGNPYFLAGQSRDLNTISDRIGRRNAWGILRPDQEDQLAALANDGDTRALKGLAYMRLDPNESRYDPQQAAVLLTQAAAKNDPEAQFELARLYEQGVGVDQDVDLALEYYWKAADQDFADAINDLGFLHFQGGSGVTRDPGKAIRLFERAANLRHPEAMFNLAALIDDGIVPGKTQSDAARYLYDSLRSGNEDVLVQLSDNPRMFKAGTRKALQILLAEKDFYDGALDADFGPQTQRGLKKAYGLEVE